MNQGVIDIIKGNLQYCKLPFVVMLQSVNDLFKTTKSKLPSVLVIGAGVAGLSTAAFLAKAGCQVRVLDKNSSLGGRARIFEADGYRFDMGPSWYWMPDVFERFFAQFGKRVADYYSLQRLDPSYRVYWHEQVVDVPADLGQLRTWFDSIEPGAAKQLDKFLAEAAYKYEVAMRKLVYMPGISVREFIDIDLIKGALRLDVFVSMKKHVARFFKDRRLQQLMEFPVLFLGAMAEHIPALYSLMNHADMVGGTWYPDGGMVRLPMAMGDLCSELGVVFQLNEEVVQLETTARRVQQVVTDKAEYTADIVIGAGDYQHIETLLPVDKQSYSAAWWDSRMLAPSALLFYLGLDGRLNDVRHHSLFFDADFEQHAAAIYEQPRWPQDPLFYMCAPSVSDKTVAPAGKENLFLLMPVTAGLSDHQALRGKYYTQLLQRLEKVFGSVPTVEYCRSYAQNDFMRDYHSFKGNAYGLANTLWQTAMGKPSCRSRKLDNLFYCGQLTVPGPGLPPALISGELVAGQILQNFR